MLTVVNYVGRVVLGALIASWADTAVARARNFTLAAGSLVLGFALGGIFYLAGKLDALSSFGGVPAAAIIFTFAVESIKKEILKRTGPAST